jgi:DNA-binding beta-propeller fold protein YncE
MNETTATTSSDLEQTLVRLNPNQGHIVVANRATGNLSILHESTGQVLGTVDLPAGDTIIGDPTYVATLNRTNEVAVADRANNQIVFFDRSTYEVTDTIATGAGNFHMWVDLKETQLWVVNDIDNTLTVIDPKTKTELERVPLPESLIGPNARPHDVILDPAGQYAYVSILQDDNPDADLLLKIDTETFEVVGSAEVGKDPHVSLAPEHNLLYVLSQDSDRIDIFDRRGALLEQVGSIHQPGAHGVTASPNGQYLYTTNLPGGGDNGLFVIDTVTNQIVGDPDGVDTPLYVECWKQETVPLLGIKARGEASVAASIHLHKSSKNRLVRLQRPYRQVGAKKMKPMVIVEGCPRSRHEFISTYRIQLDWY